MIRERQEERNLQELQQLQDAAGGGGKKRQARVDWMYSGPGNGQAGTTEELEGYLLGKRRIDGLLKGTENQKLEKSSDSVAVQAPNPRQIAQQIREDPLLAVKKQQQAAYESMMNDPAKRRALLSTEQEHKRRKHHHHHHRRHRDEDYHCSRRHSRRDEDDPHNRSRHHRRRSESYSPSHSPPARRSRHSRPSPSPYRSRRSPSPYRSRRSQSLRRRRSDSADYRDRRDRSRSPYRSNGQNGVRKMQSWHSSSRTNIVKSKSPPLKSTHSNEDDQAARLAAMQQNATDLDQDRDRRLAAIAKRDETEQETDKVARERNLKYGGRGDFVHGLNRKAGDIGLSERMRRGKVGIEREQEAY